MLKGILSGQSPFAKLGIIIIFIVAGYLLFFILGIVLSIPVFHWNLFQNPELLADFKNPESIKILKFLQLVQSIGLFVIIPFLFAYFAYPSIIESLRLKRKISFNILVITILAGICFLPFSNLLVWLNSFLELPDFMSVIEQKMRAAENSATEMTTAFLNVSDTTGLLYNVLLIAIIPAIGEELLFRGLLQKTFIELTKNIHWGVWISAIIFSTIHFQFFGFLPRLFLGVFFGYMLEYSGSLWIPIVAHFVNNLTGVLLSYFVAKNAIPNDAGDFGMTNETWFYGIVGGILGGLLFWLVVRKKNRVL
jgi:uncharacterized protein